MKRLAHFLRSVIPADPWQLCILIGSLFLILAPHVPWIPSATGSVAGIDPSFSWAIVSLLGFLEIILGAFALYTCFWPGPHPSRRVLSGVVAPTIAALIGVTWFLNYLYRGGQTSLFEKHSELRQMAELLETRLWHLSTTFYLLLMALALIGLFTSRMAVGANSLPLVLPNPKNGMEENTTWRAAMLLNVLLVSGIGRMIVNAALFTIFAIADRAHFQLKWLSAGPKLSFALLLLDAVILLAIAVAVLGKPGWQEARRVLRFPGVHALLLAAALTTAITLGGAAAQYLFDRAQWAAHSGSLDAPRFAEYFSWLRGWSAVLVFAGAAFAEELVFRGVLLRLCIRRFGLDRGIFLLGVAFVSFHFPSDSYVRLDTASVLLHLVLRMLTLLPLSYVLVWMTLRWKSILPAWIAHTFYNAFRVNERFLDWRWQVVAWVAAAVLLYRYLPLDEASDDLQAAAIEPAPIVDAAAS
jgi:membrane protease YdiL (CAAX protease family)